MWSWKPPSSRSTARWRRCWTSAVAGGGQRPSRGPLAMGGDALVSSATGLARETVRKGRREIARGEPPTSRIRAPGAGRPGIEQYQPGVLAALEALVDPLTRGGPDLPVAVDVQEPREAGRGADGAGMARELDHRGSVAPPLGLPVAVGGANGRKARFIPTATSSSNTSIRRRTGF